MRDSIHRERIWWSGGGNQPTSPPPEPPAPVPVVASGQTRVVAENAPVGTQLSALSASGSPVAWTIVGGNGAGHWEITSAGVLRTRAGLSFASTSTYVLSVTASNASGTASAPVPVTVTVTAVSAPPPVCMMAITAPASHPLNQQLAYTVSTTGACGAYQTWLLHEGSTGGPTGEGAVIGQIDSVGGAGGAYTKNLGGLQPGNYVLWARCNDTSSPCNGVWAVRPITLTGVAAPPPSGGTTVPPAILNMTTAPGPSKWTSLTSTTETWDNAFPDGDFRSHRRSGYFDAEFNSVFIRSGWWNLAFAGPDPAPAISGNQYRGRIGIGEMTSEGGASWRIQAKFPTAANIGSYRGGGAPSEVLAPPGVGSGRRMGLGHRQIAEPPGYPVQFKNIRSHWIGAKSWSLTGYGGGVRGTGWIAHDTRVCNSGIKTNTYAETLKILLGEVLITRMHLPADRNLSPNATSGHYRGEYSIGGCTFRLYIQWGATDTCLIQFRIVGGMPNHFPMHTIWEFCRSRTYRSIGHTTGARMPGQEVDDPLVSPDSWYHQCVTLIETEHDTYDLVVDTYYDWMNQV